MDRLKRCFYVKCFYTYFQILQLVALHRLDKNFVKLNTTISFTIDLTEKVVKLIFAIWFAFDLTENFVKLNTPIWFAFKLTEKFVQLHWILRLHFHLIWQKNFVKLNITYNLICFFFIVKQISWNSILHFDLHLNWRKNVWK